MNKKGSENRLIWITSMALLGLIIGLTIFSGVNNFLDDTTYWKIYYSRDLGLLLDTALTSRGKININYDFQQSNKPLAMRLFEQHVEIFDYNPKIKNPTVAAFRFGNNKYIKITPVEINSSFLKILITDKLNITKASIKIETCPPINTSLEPQKTAIYIDSNNEFIKKTMINELKTEHYNFVDNPEEATFILIVQNTSEDLMTIYYSQVNKRIDKLICTIKNSVINDNKNKISNYQILKLSEENPLKLILDKTDVTVLIKINDLDEKIAKSIVKGVIKYYG